MGCGASAEPTGFSPLAKARADPPGFRVPKCSTPASSAELSQCLGQVIQISDEQDEQDEVILLQLGAPVFRRTSNSSTEPLGYAINNPARHHDEACFRQTLHCCHIGSRPEPIHFGRFPAHCRTFGPDDGSPIASFPSGRHQLKEPPAVTVTASCTHDQTVDLLQAFLELGFVLHLLSERT